MQHSIWHWRSSIRKIAEMNVNNYLQKYSNYDNAISKPCNYNIN